MSTKRVVICGVARTPIGSFMGTLSSISAVDLGIMAVKELCSRVGLDASSGIVDDVYFGQVLQAGSGQILHVKLLLALVFQLLPQHQP